MLYPNAIERTLKREKVMQHYGDRFPKLLKDVLKDHPIDELKDKEIPQWAIDIMKDKRIGYAQRIKIVMMHQFDITNVSPSWRFVQPRDVRNAPLQCEPEAMKEARLKNRLAAIDYLQKLKQSETEAKPETEPELKQEAENERKETNTNELPSV